MIRWSTWNASQDMFDANAPSPTQAVPDTNSGGFFGRNAAGMSVARTKPTATAKRRHRRASGRGWTWAHEVGSSTFGGSCVGSGGVPRLAASWPQVPRLCLAAATYSAAVELAGQGSPTSARTRSTRRPAGWTLMITFDPRATLMPARVPTAEPDTGIIVQPMPTAHHRRPINNTVRKGIGGTRRRRMCPCRWDQRDADEHDVAGAALVHDPPPIGIVAMGPSPLWHQVQAGLHRRLTPAIAESNWKHKPCAEERDREEEHRRIGQCRTRFLNSRRSMSGCRRGTALEHERDDQHSPIDAGIHTCRFGDRAVRGESRTRRRGTRHSPGEAPACQ